MNRLLGTSRPGFVAPASAPRAALIIVHGLAEYAGRLRYEDLPAPAVHEVKRRFIDSVGTAVGAMDAPAYDSARRCALHFKSEPGATLMGGGRTSADWAAFVNGLLIRYLDYNDTYLSLEPAHPGAQALDAQIADRKRDEFLSWCLSQARRLQGEGDFDKLFNSGDTWSVE